MADIQTERLADIANVPEKAEGDEIRSMAYLLIETQSLLKLRNIQNRSIFSELTEAHNKLRQTTAREQKSNWITNVAVAIVLIIIVVAVSL